MARAKPTDHGVLGVALFLASGAAQREAQAQTEPPAGVPDPVAITLPATPVPVQLEVRERVPGDGPTDPMETRWRTVCTASPQRPCQLWLPRNSVLRANGDFPVSRPFRLEEAATTVHVKPGASAAPGLAFVGVGGGALFVGAMLWLRAGLPHSDEKDDVTAQDKADTTNRRLRTAGIFSGAGLGVAVVGIVLLLVKDDTTVEAKRTATNGVRSPNGVPVGSGMWLTPGGLTF